MEKVKLSDVCRVQGGYAFKSDEFQKNNIPVIRIGNIQETKVLVDNNICYTEEFLHNHPEFEIKKGDILIAMSGATVGKVGNYQFESRALLNQRVGKFVITGKIEKRYLYFLLQSPLFEKFILNNAFGCAQPNISNKKIEEFEFYNYEIEEQIEIATKLDKIQDIIDIRKKQIEELEKLIKSQFVELFDNDNFKKYKLEELLKMEYVVYHLDGNHGGLYPRNEEFVSSGVPYIGANCINSGKIEYDNAKYLKQERAKMFKKGVAKNNDVLFAHNATVGPVAILKTDLEYVILSTSLTAYRCNLEYINNYYLAEYLKSDDFVSQYINEMKQSTRSQVPITTQRKYFIKVPPIALQNQFAEFVKLINKQKFKIQKSLEEMQKLQESLMNKYFK